jgi:hypothetical protein
MDGLIHGADAEFMFNMPDCAWFHYKRFKRAGACKDGAKRPCIPEYGFRLA